MPTTSEFWSSIAFVVVAFVVAWLVARVGTRLVTFVLERSERRAGRPGRPGRLRRGNGSPADLARRETVASVARTSVRLVAYLGAAAVSVTQLAGLGRGVAITWASVAVVVVGFALQRLLTDLITGFFILFEDWYSVGDPVTLEPWHITGVVEEISLRATVVRTPSGELARVHNSQVLAARTLPRGMRTVRLELLVADEVAGREAVERAAAVMPTGPTAFAGPPQVTSGTRLAQGGTTHLVVSAKVAPGREWLAERYLADVIKESAPEGVVLHGPLMMEVDEQATRQFARMMGRGLTGAAA
jgi:moderate conductance mechanosensitive channel